MRKIDATIAQLKRPASEAAANSYSPYSHFPVGVAVVSESGEIYRGCNVENASFGLTQCAERAALASAIAAGVTPGKLTALVIYTPGKTAHTPCGACRQVMHELMSTDSLVVSCCDGKETKAWTRDEYLPDPFVPDSLLK
ncbi:MAG: cytidine deaminase [Xanthomonadales bacterium]|nr:cytidine deaminase [Gammaproteobacteria bacterium]MBT8055003.1 cytidine deaminase [Gammaproteobacteria bacterium]NND56385.1 cytidine deaminase [Xanthomonadales bacterium]NNK50442.1 cytidine deaminase [Xanthomonadales bacterium]